MAASLRPPDTKSGPHKEGTTGTFTATIQDNAGVAIPLASLDTVKLTLYDERTLKIINSRDKQDVKNVNNVTIHATSGLLTWSIQAADRAIQDDTRLEETHRALFEWTGSGGAVVGKHEHQFTVANLAKVP